jgi:hypothetical protein
LRYLLDLLDDAIPIEDELYERIMKLNAFGVEIRYPEIKIDFSKEDRAEAIFIVSDYREFLKKNIGFNLE